MIHDIRTETHWFTTKSCATWHVLAPGDRALCRSNVRPHSLTFSDAQRDAYPLPIPRCLPCLRKLLVKAELERILPAQTRTTIRTFASHTDALRGQEADRADGYTASDWFAYQGHTSYAVTLPVSVCDAKRDGQS